MRLAILVVLFMSLTGVSLIAHSAESQIYASAQGNINLRILGQNLSSAAKAPVEVVSMRWPYNPLRYAAYGISKALGIPCATYIVKLRIGNTLSTCNMLIAVNDRTSTFRYCSGIASQLFSESLVLTSEETGF